PHSPLFFLGLCSVALCQKYGYHFINLNKTWREAQCFCRANYTDLVTVDDWAEAQGRVCGNVSGKCPGPLGAWIGLHHRQKMDKVWHWSLPGLEYNKSQTNWFTGEGGNKQYCGFLRDGELHDGSCEKSLNFICYNNSVNTSEKKNWLGALQFCRDHHTDLTGPHLTRPCGEYWIGLFKDSWGWSNGSNSSFRNWDASEMVLNDNWNPQTNQCAIIGAQKKWRSEDCTETRPFICYDDFMILIKENMTWEEALYYCRRNHRDLAVMSNEQLCRMARERAHMADSEFVWVGLHYTCFLEAWIWVDGNYVYNSKWDGKEPSQCGFNGAMARGGNKWFGKPTENKYNFICL
ncbi:hypothetical protein NL108_014163, partial [Boleophthalmus pectinirostris]